MFLGLLADGKTTMYGRPSVWVAFDTEYRGGECVTKSWKGHREVVSWQIAFALRGELFVELLVFARTEKPLNLNQLLQLVLISVNAPRYKYRDYPKRRDKNGQWDGKSGPMTALGFSVTLIGHAGLVDLSCLGGGKRLIQYLSGVGSSLFTITPEKIVIPADASYNYFYVVNLDVRDTASYAEAGASLARLGAAVNLPKLDMSEEDYQDMAGVAVREPDRFAAYAIRDVEIDYRYMANLPIVGRDETYPPTIPACSANYVKSHITERRFLGSAEDFEHEWRGIKRVKDGLVMPDSGQSFYVKSHYEPVNVCADEL